MLFCFFFQAEDGIRDIGVTGVQTCALPISNGGGGGAPAPGPPKPGGGGGPPGGGGGPPGPPKPGGGGGTPGPPPPGGGGGKIGRASCRGKRVDLGGSRIIQKTKQQTHCAYA